MRGIPGFLRIRVVNRFDAGNSEITSDLPTLHQATWKVVLFEPGMPSSSLVGAFRIPLFPPGTKQFKQYWPTIYSKLGRYQRVEAYLGYNSRSIGLGKLAFTGVITETPREAGENARYELVGETDLGLLNNSYPFPGELTSNDVTSAILKSYLGMNELGWVDNFTPYTAGNYTSVLLPGGSGSPNWSGATDDGLNVVSVSAGLSTALIAKTGAAAGDRWHSQYAEVTGRLVPSNDATNAGQFGIGFSQSNANGNNAILGFITAQKIGGRYQLQCGIQSYSSGSILRQAVSKTTLFNVDDPNGKIPFTIGLLITVGGNSNGTANASLVVNGQVVLGQFPTAYDPQNLTFYPFVEFQTPASGSATAYFTNLVQFVRVTQDNTAGSPPPSAFAAGSISTSTNSIGYGIDPGPTFLDLWTRVATREGWLLRYNPQPFVVGTRTLGTVDFAADPGSDLTQKVIFRQRDGTLVRLALDNNSDPYFGGLTMSGLASLDGGGLGYWRDVATLQTIGVLEDQELALTNADFNTLRMNARRTMATKVSIENAGTKEATVLRAPGLADTYREGDHVTIDYPEIGINNLSARIVAREFTEGAVTEKLTLDHFSWHGAELAV